MGGDAGSVLEVAFVSMVFSASSAGSSLGGENGAKGAAGAWLKGISLCRRLSCWKGLGGLSLIGLRGAGGVGGE